MLCRMVNLTQSLQNQQDNGPLGVPVGTVLVVLIEVKKSAHSGWHHSLAENLDGTDGENKWLAFTALSSDSGMM